MKSILSIIAVTATIIILSSSMYNVDENEQVFITQFGRIVGNPINSNHAGTQARTDLGKSEAGLHWKTPFIQIAQRPS